MLRNYRRRERQLNEITALEDRWKEAAERLENNRDEILPFEINTEIFADHPDILVALNQTNTKWGELNEELKLLTRKAQLIITDWENGKENAAWRKKIDLEMSQYEELRTQFEQQGIDPDQYPLLLRQQLMLQLRLHATEEFTEQEHKLFTERKKLLKSVKENRDLLTDNRRKFLQSIRQEPKSVHIEVRPMSESRDGIEESIRSILQCPDRFDRDINYLMDNYTNSPENIQELKKAIKDIRDWERDPQDQRFATHLQSLPQESLDDLTLWFPDDGPKITFGPKNQPIQLGSPGQKNAALLAFILSYGDEPLLLDQPEDDLDNELIYNLIVEQLRNTKIKRQIIVVTHNANIVVNGDAEMVLPVIARGGQSHIEHSASIQNNDTRQRICDILEGGQQAFEQRYRRIHLERENA